MQPIPSATLVLLRDSEQGIEVLIMRRNKDVKFCGGIWVFPGGAVEAEDLRDTELETARYAAVRETMEEANVEVEVNSLLPISKWVTPEGPPKRFSTWFFVAKATQTDFQVDGSEMTEALWATPQEAIERHRQQDIDMLPPTLISLLALLPHAHVDDVLAHYQGKEPLQYFPKVCFVDDKLAMLYPGDAGYELGDAENRTGCHRCIHKADGWHYVNEIGVTL